LELTISIQNWTTDRSSGGDDTREVKDR